jgi:hypothetical protein
MIALFIIAARFFFQEQKVLSEHASQHPEWNKKNKKDDAKDYPGRHVAQFLSDPEPEYVDLFPEPF